MPIFINEYLHKELNELARELYQQHGYEVKEGFDFSASNHPQEKLMYKLAELSYDFWKDKFDESE